MASARNGRARLAVATVTAPVRCAIYTRKSTDEGLDRDFNSLDNQREAAESFIASQRHEGWTPLAERYDDGGFSGATLERPALKRLLADVEAHRLDCVVVYKLDRLSRSVRDYLNLLAFLDQHDVAFVSVTQQFNTTTPVGRMTLRMLLSFAEFERDIIAERTRDKMRAARRRGKWTGGMPPLGYDVAPEGGRLAINKEEAEQIRAIFELYLGRDSLLAVADELNRRGWRNKSWTTKDGKRRQGRPWDRVNLRTVLTNPLYAGLQKLGDETFPGEHPAIVSKALFNKVQQLMDENRFGGGASSRNVHGSLLRGLLRCSACDRAMSHAWTRKGKKLFRYYVCQRAQKSGAAACPTKSVHAERIEQFVVDQIKRIGADPELQAETFRQAVAQLAAQRRGVKAEVKRLERELRDAQLEVDRLVAAVANAQGSAQEALASGLGKSHELVRTIEARLREVRIEEAQLAAQTVDEADVARALQAFDPIWDVLLVAERERVLHFIIERVDYDGASQKLDIHWRLAGFGELAAEVGS